MNTIARHQTVMTVIISGPPEIINKFIEDHSKTYQVEKIEVTPQIFKEREEHAIAQGDEPPNETTRQMSDLLWRKYNGGIHPESEVDGGFVGVICLKTTKFNIDIIAIVGSLSCQYPDLFFEVTCDDTTANWTSITLLVAG